jgi:uncharacterized protein
MLNKCYLVIGIFFSFLSLNSQDLSGDTVLENALFWKISGNGLSQPSYLYGTIHIICADQVVVPDTVFQAFISSKEIFFEAVFRRKDGDTTNTIFMEKRTLKSLIGKRNFEKIKSFLDSYRPISEEKLDKIKPFEVERLLLAASLGCRTIQFDDTLKKLANQNHLLISGLENSKDHNKPIDNVPLWQQADNLLNRYQQIIEGKSTLPFDIDLYLKQNITEIYEQGYYKADGSKREEAKYFLDERNLKWIPVIVDAIKKEQAFFVFGCSHLVGANGIIGLLRAKGYTLTPVPINLLSSKNSH